MRKTIVLFVALFALMLFVNQSKANEPQFVVLPDGTLVAVPVDPPTVVVNSVGFFGVGHRGFVGGNGVFVGGNGFGGNRVFVGNNRFIGGNRVSVGGNRHNGRRR